MTVKEGSIWAGAERTQFQVISVVETDGHTWVHYREHPKNYRPVAECKEYSCYLESFVHRFSPIVT